MPYLVKSVNNVQVYRIFLVILKCPGLNFSVPIIHVKFQMLRLKFFCCDLNEIDRQLVFILVGPFPEVCDRVFKGTW